MQQPMVIGYGSRPLQWVMVVAFLGLAVAFLRMHFAGGSLIVLGFALACAILPSTRVDSRGDVIERQWKLLGALLLWRHRVPVSELHSVFLEWDEEPQPDWRVWAVGLKRNNGRKMIVSYFNVRPGCACAEAEGLAKELARAVGLPLGREN